jgi:hypothetical protein
MLCRGPIAIALCVVMFAGSRDAARAQAATPVVVSGYQISQWVGPSTSYTNPDSVVSDGTHIFVGYQNVTAKDGSDNKMSTIVEYTMAGSAVTIFTVPGHCDGLRIDPSTHLLWATSNEDGNAVFETIDPASGAITPYQFPAPAPHGGGYDDMAFAGGTAFIAASNPNVNSAGVNTSPALDKMTIAAGQVSLTPVLMGNAPATDVTTKQTVTLNEVDPDSMYVDPQGDVVLDNQGGAELVFLQNAGTASQTVTRLPLGTQVDDFVWATSPGGSLFVVDGKANTIWKMSGKLAPGTVYVEAPSDSGVASFVGTLDLTSGTITPIGVGFVHPTGLAFIPASGVTLAAKLFRPGLVRGVELPL